MLKDSILRLHNILKKYGYAKPLQYSHPSDNAKPVIADSLLEGFKNFINQNSSRQDAVDPILLHCLLENLLNPYSYKAVKRLVATLRKNDTK